MIIVLIVDHKAARPSEFTILNVLFGVTSNTFLNEDTVSSS